VPGILPALARAVRRHHRVRQERRLNVLMGTLAACGGVIIWAIDLKWLPKPPADICNCVTGEVTMMDIRFPV
jgi:hypothetical protein